jgi:hypothetical protein
MGSTCCYCCSSKLNAEDDDVDKSEEIEINKYTSKYDNEFSILEKKYNYISNITFRDFAYSLNLFSMDNATLEDDYSKMTLEYSANDAFYNEPFSSDLFQSFIENKLFKHKILYEESENNERAMSIFKTFLLESYNALEQKLSQNNKQKGNEAVDENSLIIKGYLIPIAILHCGGPKYVKVRTIFNLFQEGGNLKPSEKFNNFLLALFLTAAYSMIHVRNKLSNYDEIGAIDLKELVKLADTAELKDSLHLVEVTNKLIFGEDLSQTLDYGAFKAKFNIDNKETSLGYLLNASGVRYMQKQHNV